MASSDIKHDYNMEAGLLNNHEEERLLSKEAQFQDEELDYPMANTRKTSAGRRVLMALGICFLVGIALVSIGSATGICPGHLRHAMDGQMSIKDAVHSHRPNDSHAQMARRQNTPVPSQTQGSTSASQPSATQNSNTAAATTASQAQSTSNQATSQSQAASSQAQSTRASQASSAQGTTQAESSKAASSDPGTSQTEAPSRTSSSSPSDTSASVSSARSLSTSQSDASTASSASSASLPSSTESIGSETTATEASATQETITTGTQSTSSAVAKTFTSTLPNGGVTTMTSTSWVQVVPKASSTSNPNLQNAAPSQHSFHSILTAVVGMLFGGLLLL